MEGINTEKFIHDFFTAYQCKVTKKEEGVLEVNLTEEMDKALMNRPFYWQYIKSLGQKGEPMKLTFITEPTKMEVQGEWMDIGSPRLQQMFQHVIQNEKYTLLFEEVQTTESTPLYPWLVTNIRINYKGRQSKQELISLGIQLIQGKIVVNMMDELDKRMLKQQISNFCYTLSPIITLKSGYKRLENIILNYIEDQPKMWAVNAKETIEEEKQLLKTFYQDDTNELYKKEVEELNKRYQPKIETEVINGGLIYLRE